MNKTKEALKMAIETLAYAESCTSELWGDETVIKAINACKEALESQKPLSDDEIDKIVVNCETLLAKDIAHAIEQAHGIGVKDGTRD